MVWFDSLPGMIQSVLVQFTMWFNPKPLYTSHAHCAMSSSELVHLGTSNHSAHYVSKIAKSNTIRTKNISA
ncbi:hypothetical protein UPYG_G00128110 [Umbra pygmaea]|uniref:Uncharacterized protein n=1 Tax=Umbra pygmaea TaxID=75934 RepID=A0ABD0X6H8_UMBPY